MSTQRVRSKVLEDSYHTSIQTKNGSPTGNQFTSHLAYDYHSMTDYVTEGFARRISQGEIINNPCLYEEVQWVTGNGYQEVGPYLVEGGSYSDYVVQTYAPPYWSDTIDLDFLSIDDVGSDQGVRQNCLSHVNVPAFDFGEDALELRETIRFLKNPLRSLNSLARTFQKKAIKKGAYSYSTGVERAKALADVWASYSFAARPLIQSIQEAVDAYTAKLVLPPRMTSRSSDSFSESGFEYQFLTGGSDEEVGVNVNIDVQRDFKVGILYTADTTDDLAYRLGFRLRDWPSTLWEVLPLSFMVDRVVNIKNTINGVVNLLDPNVKILAAWVVNKSERKVSYQVVHYAHSQYTSSFYGDPCALRQFRYQREVWTPGVDDLIPAVTPGRLIGDVSSTLDTLTVIANRLL